jgi:hypothetical protein
VKITRLVFILTCAALLASRTSYAAQSYPASQQLSSESAASTVRKSQEANHAILADSGKQRKDGNLSDGRRETRHMPEKNHPRSPAIITTITKDRHEEAPNNRKSSQSGNAMNPHHPGSDKSHGLAKGGSTRQETGNRAMRVRPPSAVRPTVPPLNNSRHRGANPAVIGGSANSGGRNSGVINGTHMNRRPAGIGHDIHSQIEP